MPRKLPRVRYGNSVLILAAETINIPETWSRCLWTDRSAATPHRTPQGQASEDREPLADGVIDAGARLGTEDAGGIKGPHHRRRPLGGLLWASWVLPRPLRGCSRGEPLLLRESLLAALSRGVDAPRLWPPRRCSNPRARLQARGGTFLGLRAFRSPDLTRLPSLPWRHDPHPVLAHKEPGEHGAVEEVKGEGGALEAEDAGRDPDDEPAGLHRRGCGGGYQRVPGPQEVLWRQGS
jgi:hypothetical protein